MEISGSTSEIHVHCRTVLIVVNFWRRYSNFCCRLCKLFYFWWINVSGLHVIKGALHILKKNKKKTKGLTIYCISFVNETWFCCLVIFIRYLNGLAALLSITNVVVLWYEPGIYDSGSPNVHQGIIGIIYLWGLASFSMDNVVVLWYESWI